jgi:uncharacterized protein
VKCVIVDTGPLVAFLNANDSHHKWARESLMTVEPPLLTCQAVLSEKGQDAVLNLVARGVVEVAFRCVTNSVPCES